jgi:hypothetical protein
MHLLSNRLILLAVTGDSAFAADITGTGNFSVWTGRRAAMAIRSSDFSRPETGVLEKGILAGPIVA